MEEILFLTYELIRGTKTGHIEEEYFFASHTLTDWGQFINETILYFIEISSEKIGGFGKTIDVDESKFGKRKYPQGHPVKGQLVIGGVERESGKFFLVAVHDQSKETLIGLIKQWIEPGTTIYSAGLSLYQTLEKEDFDYLTITHGVNFVDPTTDCPINANESTWRSFKDTLPTHKQPLDFQFHLAYYMFEKSCSAKRIDHFSKFLEIITDINWEEFKVSV